MVEQSTEQEQPHRVNRKATLIAAFGVPTLALASATLYSLRYQPPTDIAPTPAGLAAAKPEPTNPAPTENSTAVSPQLAESSPTAEPSPALPRLTYYTNADVNARGINVYNPSHFIGCDPQPPKIASLLRSFPRFASLIPEKSYDADSPTVESAATTPEELLTCLKTPLARESLRRRGVDADKIQLSEIIGPVTYKDIPQVIEALNLGITQEQAAQVFGPRVAMFFKQDDGTIGEFEAEMLDDEAEVDRLRNQNPPVLGKFFTGKKEYFVLNTQGQVGAARGECINVTEFIPTPPTPTPTETSVPSVPAAPPEETPVPPPTETSVPPPTETPQPQETPTPTPTNTEVPSPTPTQELETPTPAPTNTHVPMPTATREVETPTPPPTEIPPSPTPAPTNTHVPMPTATRAAETPTPIPPETATPVPPPTETPPPTEIPPSSTPAPTNTHVPMPTATEAAVFPTPIPAVATDTPIPAPTETPPPTEVPPSPTPAPTNTEVPMPTATRVPPPSTPTPIPVVSVPPSPTPVR